MLDARERIASAIAEAEQAFERLKRSDPEGLEGIEKALAELRREVVGR